MVNEISDYETKFSEFVKLCNTSEKGTAIMIAEPEILGDSYDEIVESLNRMSDAELCLAIVPRSKR